VASKKAAKAKKTAKAKRSGRAERPDDVDGFLRELRHPLKPALEAVRRILLGGCPDERAPSARDTPRRTGPFCRR
jgi:hypothetical protein